MLRRGAPRLALLLAALAALAAASAAVFTNRALVTAAVLAAAPALPALCLGIPAAVCLQPDARRRTATRVRRICSI